MVEKQILIFFRKKWHFWLEWVFFLVKTTLINLFYVKQTRKSDCARVWSSARSRKKVMVEKPKKSNFFFGKIDIYGRNGPFFSFKLPPNNLFYVIQIRESDWKRVWGSARSLKKVMVEKQRNPIFFRKNWHSWLKWAFFLIETALKQLILSKTDPRNRLRKS